MKGKAKRSWRGAFRFAWDGFRYALRSERNMKVHVFAAAAVFLGGAICGLSAWAWCALLIAVALVWMTELFNTAMERMVDFVSPQHRPEARRVKDLAAGAVLVAALFAAAIGCVVFADRLLK